MIYFVGTTFAARHLKNAAIQRGVKVTDNYDEATLIFVSEDIPTDKHGVRDLDHIRKLIPTDKRPVVLTSQVPIGFTRSLSREDIYHQAETLRIIDAEERALNPEQIIVGMGHYVPYIPDEYSDYLDAFGCPIHWMSWEEAEFSKIAINLTLISQVENTNRLFNYATKHNINWSAIKKVLQTDKRIGKEAYLNPGEWRDSPHLLRDWVTFESS